MGTLSSKTKPDTPISTGFCDRLAPRGASADIMDDMQAMLEAGRVPLTQILTTYPQLDIRKWTPLLLTSKSNPRRQMRFVIETGQRSSDFLYRITWLLDSVQCRTVGSDGKVCTSLPSEVLFGGMLGSAVEKAWTDAAGLKHREDDEPALVKRDRLEWFCHGKQHREGGRPAVHIRQWGGGARRLMWFVDGQQHRDGDQAADMESWEGDNGRRDVYQEFFTRGTFVKAELQKVSAPLHEWVLDNVHFKDVGCDCTPW